MSEPVSLGFTDLRLRVQLGCGDEERATPQPVALDVRIGFATVPAACRTDRLEDTLCYAELCEAAEKHCAGREFNTLERLAQELADVLSRHLPPGSRLGLRVTKLRPPVRNLCGGVQVTLGEV